MIKRIWNEFSFHTVFMKLVVCFISPCQRLGDIKNTTRFINIVWNEISFQILYNDNIYTVITQTRAPRGTDRSPEYNEHFCYKLDSRVKNLTTEWNQKQQHFITHASRSLLWIRFVAVAFRSEEEVFWRRGPPPPWWPILPHWICPWANMAKTSLSMCRAMSTSSLPSFVNIHSVVLW